MTGQELFEKAIDLCGLKSVNSDSPTDIKDLEQRALSLINILLAENTSLDCRIRKAEHKLISIGQLSDEIDCSEIVASAVLPYGLARLFMVGEDDGLAADMNRFYSEGRNIAISFGKARTEEITEVYS